MGITILGIAPHNSDLETVLRVAGRGKVFQGSDIDGIAEYLLQLIEGNILVANKPESFSWLTLAQQMDVVLKMVLK